jgi:hypothetical protein
MVYVPYRGCIKFGLDYGLYVKRGKARLRRSAVMSEADFLMLPPPEIAKTADPSKSGPNQASEVADSPEILDCALRAGASEFVSTHPNCVAGMALQVELLESGAREGSGVSSTCPATGTRATGCRSGFPPADRVPWGGVTGRAAICSPAHLAGIVMRLLLAA